MKTYPTQQQTVSDDGKGAPPPQMSEYNGGYSPQSGYQQQEYPPNPPIRPITRIGNSSNTAISHLTTHQPQGM